MSTNTPKDGKSPHDSIDDEPATLYCDPRPVDGTHAQLRLPRGALQVEELNDGQVEAVIGRGGALEILVDLDGADEETHLGATLEVDPDDAEELAADLLDSARVARKRRRTDR